MGQSKKSRKKKELDPAMTPQDGTPADLPAAKVKVEVAPFPWNRDDSKLVFSLLTAIEKDENRVVLCGKKTGEKSTGDRKSAVYRRMAQELFPDLCSLSAVHFTLVSERVRVKTESLFKQYKEKAKRLFKTGEGIGGEDSSQESTDQYATCYLGEEGPDTFTPPDIANIWDEILVSFPPFKRLHKLLSTRPNMVPPIVITGVGPEGRKVVHYQETEEHRKRNNHSKDLSRKDEATPDEAIDPQLLAISGTQIRPSTPVASRPSFATLMKSPSPSPPRAIFDDDIQELPPLPLPSIPAIPHAIASKTKINDKENVPPTVQTPNTVHSTPGPVNGRQALANAIRKVDSVSSVKRIPAKRTLEDNLLDMHRENLQFSREKAQTESNLKKRKSYMQEREFLSRQRTAYRKDLDEGLMTRERYLSLSNKLIERDELLADKLEEMDNMEIH